MNKGDNANTRNATMKNNLAEDEEHAQDSKGDLFSKVNNLTMGEVHTLFLTLPSYVCGHRNSMLSQFMELVDT